MDIDIVRKQLEAAERFLDTAISQEHKRLEKTEDAREMVRAALVELNTFRAVEQHTEDGHTPAGQI